MLNSIFSFFTLILVLAIIVVFYINIKNLINEHIGKFMVINGGERSSSNINDDNGTNQEIVAKIKDNLIDVSDKSNAEILNLLKSELLKTRQFEKEFVEKLSHDTNKLNDKLIDDVSSIKTELNNKQQQTNDAFDKLTKQLNQQTNDAFDKLTGQLDQHTNNVFDKLTGQLNHQTNNTTDKITKQLKNDLLTIKDTLNSELINNIKSIKSDLLKPNDDLLKNLQTLQMHLLEPNQELIKHLQTLKNTLSNLQKTPNDVNLLTVMNEIKTKMNETTGIGEKTLAELKEFSGGQLDGILEKLKETLESNLKSPLTNAMENTKQIIVKNHDELTNNLDKTKTELTSSFRKKIETEFKDNMTTNSIILNDIKSQINKIVVKNDSINEEDILIKNQNRDINDKLIKSIDEIKESLVDLPESFNRKVKTNKSLLTLDNVDESIIHPLSEKINDCIQLSSLDNKKAQKMIIEPLSDAFRETIGANKQDIINKFDEYQRNIENDIATIDSKFDNRIIKNNDKLNDTISNNSKIIEKLVENKIGNLDDHLSEIGKDIIKEIDNPLTQRMKNLLNDEQKELITEPLIKEIKQLPKKMKEIMHDMNDPFIHEIKQNVTEPIMGDLKESLITRMETTLMKPLETNLRNDFNGETKTIIKKIEPIENNITAVVNRELGNELITRINKQVANPLLKDIQESIWHNDNVENNIIKPIVSKMKDSIMKPVFEDVDKPLMKRIKSSVTDVLIKDLNEPLTKRIKREIESTVKPIVENSNESIRNYVKNVISNDLEKPLNNHVVDKLTNLFNENHRQLLKVQNEKVQDVIKQIENTPKTLKISNDLYKLLDELRNNQNAINDSVADASKSKDVENVWTRIKERIERQSSYFVTLHDELLKEIKNNNNSSILMDLNNKTIELMESIKNTNGKLNECKLANISDVAETSTSIKSDTHKSDTTKENNTPQNKTVAMKISPPRG